MKNLNCTFYRPKTVNIKEFCNIVGKLRADLHRLETEKQDEWSVYRYVYALCKSARATGKNPDMKFLNIHDPNGMPPDARVDFVYIPTYLATAFMMKTALLYPSLLDDLTFLSSDLDFCAEDVRKALAGYMLGCTGRHFDGAGFFALDDLVKLFADADAAEFLKRHADLCPAFSSLFFSAHAAVPTK